MTKSTLSFSDCSVSLRDNTLTVANSKIRRILRITGAGVVPVSLTDTLTDELLTEALPDCEATLFPAGFPDAMPAALSLEGGEDDDYGFAVKHLNARLLLEYTDFSVKLEVHIYPGLPVIRTRVFLRGKAGIPSAETGTLDAMAIGSKHCEWESILMRAVTDSHNNLVTAEKGLFYFNETRRLSGNILKIHRTLQNDGIVLIKEAPAADEQVRYPGYDFTISGRKISVRTAGLSDSDIHPDEFVPIYGCTVGLYHGGDEEFYRLLHDYHEARHAFDIPRDVKVLCNTWGDGSQGKNICEPFLEDELDAAHMAGITHYQIDAGWNVGTAEGTAGKWAINRQALPYAFKRLHEKADRYGMTLGLWFEPQCEDGRDYASYIKDAQILTDFYHKHGIRFFKLDGFKLLSYTATWRFERMMQLVLKDTNCNTFFDMDITNWPRTGFFGATQYASLFMENRYTDTVSYYPHYTLKNLHDVCRYFPSYRIECEFLNVERNRDKYGDEDELAPARCGEAFALAVTLFASPLAWFEATGLSDRSRHEIAGILDAMKKIQPGILSSMVLPIGDYPAGNRFSGFQAIQSGRRGYLLFLKGKTEETAHEFLTHTGGFGEGTEFKLIIANCECTVNVERQNELSVAMEGDFRFAVYEYSV